MSPRPRALLSVYDKSGLLPFAQRLVELGYQLIASGGTQRALCEAHIDCTPVRDITGAPEILDGRVKTLHPIIHGGILARPIAEHRAELALHGITAIDVVVCNLYPFARTAAAPDASEADIIEQIDIGGVTLLRAAAKNFDRVTVLCDPADYERAAEALAAAAPDPALRRHLALKAFQHTAAYDAAIAGWFAQRLDADPLTDALHLAMPRVGELRYGENPHQRGALYLDDPARPPMQALQGKALSYNNIADLDAAWDVVASFDPPAAAVIKHLTPCGVALGEDPADALTRALAADPTSAFGAVLALNRPFDLHALHALGALFVEAIAAPAFEEDALDALAAGRRSCRAVLIDPTIPRRVELRTIRGGLLAQTPDRDEDEAAWRCVTSRHPTDAERADLAFAWRVARHVRSNAIVLATDLATVGVGGGDTSRVDAAARALSRAGERARGAVVASDAFFPFADALEIAARAGVTAAIQPGGSVRDAEVIAAAEQHGVAMIFTGTRHFKH